MKNNYPSFVKYRKIPHLAEALDLLDNKIEVYEKLDGGNTQIRKYKGRVLCGNRSGFLKNPKYFTQDWFKSFQDWALSNYSFYNLPENLIVYGEWLAKHTLDYYPQFTDNFFLIDVFDLDSKRFIPYENAVELLNDLNVKKVNFLEILAAGRFNFEDLEELICGSKYRNGDKEGIVIKNYPLQRFAKLWASSVKQKTVTEQDISRIVCSLKDEKKRISVYLVYKELLLDLHRSKFKDIEEEKIKRKVEEYLNKTNLLEWT